jgi:hypothetical protein
MKIHQCPETSMVTESFHAIGTSLACPLLQSFENRTPDPPVFSRRAHLGDGYLNAG